jgi:hypothetical protein
MKERLHSYWKEISCLNQKIKGLEFNLDTQVEYLNADRIRDLENDLSNHDAWLIGACRNKGELCAQVFDLEAQVGGLRVAWINFCQEQQDADENTNDESL